MKGLLKNRYNYESLYKVASDIQFVYDSFQVDEFLHATLDERWNDMELKERIYCISKNLSKFLPEDYGEAICIIDKVVMNYGSWLEGFCGFFPIFVEMFGQNEKDWELSMDALERYTTYASSEIAIRSFIVNDEKRVMDRMYQWSKSKDENIRRLASEGCRPLLPWGQALPNFKKNPALILPILEQLKMDNSLHVRRSVANNINDISKTNPEIVIEIAKKWYGKNEHTDWIVKHGCRTLLKKGNSEVLAIFGFYGANTLMLDSFEINKKTIALGEDLIFSFSVLAKMATKVRLEYKIDYVKANGKRNRKVFKISEVFLNESNKKFYTKKHSFSDISIRKHYEGIHSITIVCNGIDQSTLDFELTV